MKIQTHPHSGLSLVEVAIVLATIVLLGFFLLPHMTRTGTGSSRISCTSNLKQVGLAYRLYANDHDDNFPWLVSTNFNPTNTSGSREFMTSPQVFRHFQAMSNELVTPKVLACFTDTKRTRTIDFSNFSN